MLNIDALTFQEFVMHETLPLSKIQEAILIFLQGREDIVLFGAQAVNAYVSDPRMTQDVDLLSIHAENVANELRNLLSTKFQIAVRIREVAEGKGFRIYQIRKQGNRHLVDLRAVENLPESKMIENIQVLSPVELITSKVISYCSRKGKPKAGTDYRDLGMLLLRFDSLKDEVIKRLLLKNVSEDILETWAEIEKQDFRFDDDEDLTF